jgi:putative restriction endonuclease
MASFKVAKVAASKPATGGAAPHLFYQTKHGRIYHGDAVCVLAEFLEAESVDLVVTSPPFGLVRKKDYGNADDGLSFGRKTNDEIAIGIRQDQFVNYCLNASALHREGRQARTLDLLNKASALQEIRDEDLTGLNEPRRRIVQQVSRLSRDGNFRWQVLQAYGNRCSITGTQLRLVDAAHVLPVGAPGSVDKVYNGLALSPTYHRAFDNGLIYLNDQYKMRINQAKEAELRAMNLAGGIDGFRASLGRILLPPDPAQRPRLELVRKANKYRLIAV